MAKPTVSTTFNAVNKMSGPMKKMQASVKKFGVVAGAAMVGAGLAAARSTIKFAETGDEIAKTARKIGVSVEALQELRFAADRSGVSASTLDGALQKLNKNVGDLRAGSGTLTTLLNKTNPALAKQLKNVETNEEAFTLLVDQISKMENPMERAALAQAAFGRAGQDLIIMAEGGVDGLNALTEEARKYGNIMSTDAAQSSEEFIDAMTNAKASISALKNNALIPLVKAFTPLIQKIADVVSANRELIDQKIQSAMDAVTKSVKLVVSAWNSGLIPAVLAAVATFKAITGAIALYKTALVAAKAIQIAFNVALAANPIGLAVVAISALVAGVVLLAKNLEPVRDWFLKIGELIGPIFDKIGVITSKVGKIFGDDTSGFSEDEIEQQRGRNPYARPAISANQGAIDNQRAMTEQVTRTSRSSVDVNLNNLPNGSTVRQKGQAEGVTLNYGYQTGRM